MRPSLPKIDPIIRKLGFDNVANQLLSLLLEQKENDDARGTSGRNVEESQSLNRAILRLEDSILEYKKS